MTKKVIVGLVSGALFGVGLVISGMTKPTNIKGFLDVTGDFKPNLALVMAGAVFVYAVAIRLPRRAAVTTPVSLSRPAKRVDVPLVVGAAVFGVGWGLSGYCPGPAIVAIGFGGAGIVVFIGATLAGVFLADGVRAGLGAGSSRASEPVEQGEVAKAT